MIILATLSNEMWGRNFMDGYISFRFIASESTFTTWDGRECR